MNILLIPGFWLDGSSWDAVAGPLRAAGHAVTALTLPGLESLEADRSAITLRDHVDAVVAAIDATGGPVILVGHSGGGAIAHAAADARPDAVQRVIYVDSVPLGDGDCINDSLPAVNGEIPLPDWSVFDDDDLVDLDESLREHFRRIAIPQPEQVAAGRQVLGDEQRYAVPATVIACEFPASALSGLIDRGSAYTAELARMTDYEFVDLPTGHWPQLTRPADLAAAIVGVLER